MNGFNSKNNNQSPKKISNTEKKLLKDKNHLDKILEKGSKRADLLAKTNLKKIYEIIGLTKFT